VRLLLAKECELRFFRWRCVAFLRDKKIEVGLSSWVFVSFLPSKKKIKKKIEFLSESQL
jgi:hypothetical protein